MVNKLYIESQASYPDVIKLKPTIMETKTNNSSINKEIQVYKKDFFSGVLLLARRLFMF